MSADLKEIPEKRRDTFEARARGGETRQADDIRVRWIVSGAVSNKKGL